MGIFNRVNKQRLNDELVQAVRFGTVADVKTALDRGADVHTRFENGTGGKRGHLVTAAILEGRDDAIILSLLDHGATVHGKNHVVRNDSRVCVQARTSLVYAIRSGRSSHVIDRLLLAGSPVQSTPSMNDGPLLEALRFDSSYSVIQSLIEYGADLSGAILTAARCVSDPAIFQILVGAGANIYERDSRGKSVVVSAILSNKKCAKILPALLRMSSGSDDRCLDCDNRTALMIAIVDKYKPDIYQLDIEVVQIILDAGADVRQLDKKGKSAFDYAKNYSGVHESGIFDRLKFS